jgi:hypothetical protein
LFAVLITTACEFNVPASPSDSAVTDPQPTPVVSIDGVVPGVSSGSVEMVFWRSQGDTLIGEQIAATTTVGASGRFSFQSLPDIEEDYPALLFPVSDVAYQGSAEISDSSVMIAAIDELRVKDDSGTPVGELFLGESEVLPAGSQNVTIIETESVWIYATGETDVELSDDVDRLRMSLRLVSGWNSVIMDWTGADYWVRTYSGAPTPNMVWHLLE